MKGYRRRVRVGIRLWQWGWRFPDLQAAARVVEYGGFEVLSCIDHVTCQPRGQRGWDAPSFLAAMAGMTGRIRLAVHVINASLRHPLLLAGQLAVAQAASGGRVEVGLGAGSFGLARYDHVATGIPFPDFEQRVERVARCCQLLPALWRGDEVDEPAFGMVGASLGPLDIVIPPVVVGGTSERLLDVAARHANGWNAGGVDTARFRSLARRLDEGCERAGRERLLTKELLVPIGDADKDALRRRLDEAEHAGATTAILDVIEGDPRLLDQLTAVVVDWVAGR